MIILKPILFVYKPKYFWMIHLIDHFLLKKTMCLFVGSGFLVSQSRLRKLRHFYGLSPLGTMSDHDWRVFHLMGGSILLADTRHIFSLQFGV